LSLAFAQILAQRGRQPLLALPVLRLVLGHARDMSRAP
jgi:hypothetical protein